MYTAQKVLIYRADLKLISLKTKYKHCSRIVFAYDSEYLEL